MINAEEFSVASLERMCEMAIEQGLQDIKEKQPSLAMAEVTEITQRTIVAIALNQTSVEKVEPLTQQEYKAWDELAAANVLGVSHKQLRTLTKKFELIPPKVPEPEDAQQDMF